MSLQKHWSLIVDLLVNVNFVFDVTHPCVRHLYKTATFDTQHLLREQSAVPDDMT